MPRFGVAFNRRKSTAAAEDLQNASVTEQSSFRVLERTDPSAGKAFDGGARMARASGSISKSGQLDLGLDDNMFADLKNNRGSGASNSTKATSTDASSRHSNASTAPSSADFVTVDDSKFSKKNLNDVPPRSAPKTSTSGFLNRAGRTFSFGQKKASIPPPSSPDVPPVPSIRHDDYTGRARGMTESTTSTATPPKLEETGGLDMGGDFGSMFTTFDKRASMATLKNSDGSAAPRSLTGNRPIQPPPLSITKIDNNKDKVNNPQFTPDSWKSRNSDENLLSSSPISVDNDIPPPVPRHQTSFKTSSRPSDIIEDEDAKLLADSLSAGQILSESNSYSRNSGWKREEDSYNSFSRRPLNSSFKKGDDNMFEGTPSHTSRIVQRFGQNRSSSPPRNKVMTPAQFEKYRQDKERQGVSDQAYHSTENDDEDEINYDDDEDELEKTKQQTRQRRKQEAHMAVYRQQMMKVTGEQPDMQPAPERQRLSQSMSAPHLNVIKVPSPGPSTGISDEDEDEEVPLAILQAHGFPAKNRPPTRLSTMGSNPNLRASIQPQPRPGSMVGDPNSTQRHSTLPAFARNLPQDPFVGASIAKPAMRETLSYGGGSPAGPPQQQPQPQGIPHGGLVGVIANEERSRAMRRGSPVVNQSAGPAFDPAPGSMMHGMANGGGIQGHMGMQGMPGMPGMPQMMPPQMTLGDQAQLQMTQQMSQFMQMQMQFMQMMATNNGQQNGGAVPQMYPPPYGGLAATQSMNDLSSRHSMMMEPTTTLEPPRRLDPGMRTMSMIQPSSSSSFIQQPGYAGSVHGLGAMGYAPSIAPSERSNIGLPGRYRPVSQAMAPSIPDTHQRTHTMSGALGRWDENKTKSTINIVNSGDGSDDDDEQGWEAMKAKRDKKRTLWKSKKSFSNELSTMI